MHCLFLGNLRHHCRDVWGLDVKDKSTKKIAPHTPDEQQLWLNRLVTALRKRSRPSLAGIRKGYLAAVAQVNDIVPEFRLTKKDYIANLLKWAELNPIDSLVLPPILEEATADFYVADGPHDISKFRVLTQDVIDTIRADIANTVLPSWMERPPRNFGCAAHGKLKADQWRTVCTVNLMITLVRLWGVASASQRNRLLLDNFIHLVTAVDLATRRSMDEERARAFDRHMLQYLQGLRDLFSHDLVPNHHLSLHLMACLLMFGPVHGWWGFPFERYNGILQAMNINNLPEDIPFTFMRGFYCGTELRWLMGSVQWPDHDTYREMVAAYNAAFSDAVRGTRASDMAASASGADDVTYNAKKQVGLSHDYYAGLLCHMPSLFTSYDASPEDPRPRIAPYGQRVPSTSNSGVMFATQAYASRDSYVFAIVHSDGQQRSRAAQIFDIFLHSRLEDGKNIVSTFVVIDTFAELVETDAAHDAFRAYPELETQLCYDRKDARFVVPLTDIKFDASFNAIVFQNPSLIFPDIDAHRNMQQRRVHQARRAELYDSRLRVVALTGLERHMLLFTRLSPDNMSDDETDRPPFHRPRTYRIIESRWQSLALKTFLRGLDALYRQGWDRSRPRVRFAGAPPRVRIPQEGGPEADGLAPTGLWRNCYDKDWLRTLDADQRNTLEVIDDDYDFSLRREVPVMDTGDRQAGVDEGTERM
ncbi:hypothetical protein ONZ51_g12806 [Trametes cubensis]|uniref:DUF4218 domain-containing protein n=1 Tax=Trametes cubensis TaxID=1111947 RepID=A0AAD7TFD5_9APHY|nr:hypothetical protein ONZ51_g12806 [Trametes cubensis]